MKILNRNNVLLTLLTFVLISFTACVEDDDFDTPSSQILDPDFITNFNEDETDIVSINTLVGLLVQEQGNVNGNGTLDYSDENTTYTFTFESKTQVLEGYVISSDEGGNFFEEILLQNDYQNPTSGVKVLLDVNPLFTLYDVGRKVYIKLNDPINGTVGALTIGISNGVFTLGQANGNEVDKISPADHLNHIFRSSERQDLVPLPLNISEFTEDKTNLFVQLQDVQFNRNQAGQISYAGEGSDQFDGERTLESCNEASSVVFSTSTFADFKAATLAPGRGTVNGILTRNFQGEVFNIVVNTLEGVQLTNTERCDPDFLECTGASGGGSAIFLEDFEGFGTYASEGWDNINISGTDTDWFISSFSGNFYSRISAFSSGNSEADVWLVTPAINMDGTTGEELSFDVQANFDNGTNLTVWISTDYAGDPTTATWSILDASIPVGPSSTFGSFETVGPINISCVDGDAVIGFFYEGSDPSATTRYHVDNVTVTGN